MPERYQCPASPAASSSTTPTPAFSAGGVVVVVVVINSASSDVVNISSETEVPRVCKGLLITVCPCQHLS